MPQTLAHFHTRLNFGATCRQHLVRDSTYNARGWRVKKLVDNSDTLDGTFRMIYNQSWQLLEILSVSGGSTTVAKQFIHAGPGVSDPSGRSVSPSNRPYIDDHIAMLTPSGGGWTAHYYHTDDLFNTLAISDSSAAVAERAQVEPYGTASLTDATGNPLNMSAIANPFVRQGILRDWETGNDDNRHRWYGPAIGRWASRDPVIANGGVEGSFELFSANAGARGSRNAIGAGSTATNPCPPGPFRPTGPIIEHPEMQVMSGVPSGLPSGAYPLVEYLGSNPQSNVDPSGLFSIIDPFTGPSISSCCIPFSATTTTSNVVDAGYTTRQSTEGCECGVDSCGRPRNGTRVCTYHDHYIRFTTSTTTSTWYVKSSETRCNGVICPSPTTTTTHTFGPPEWGHSEFMGCTPCVCP